VNPRQVTLSGQEGLSSRAMVLEVALMGVRDGHPEAGERARRVARSLRGLARSYGIAELIEAAWVAEDAPDAELANATGALLDVLQRVLGQHGSRTAVILLVEDDRVMARALGHALGGPGHEVEVASTMAEGQRVVDARAVSLVVLDLSLPDGDGRDMLVRLREKAATAHVPVVILSGENRPEVQAECLALGADLYMDKASPLPLVAAAISAKIRREADLARVTRLDGLTGLPNRAAFEVAFEQFRAHARRTGKPMALGLVDLDHFKSVNDTYGHLVGDEVLMRVAQVLGRALRQSDFIARWGGEEMVVMLPDTDAPGAVVALQKALETLRAEVFKDGGDRTFSVTFSAGVAETAAGSTVEDAVAAADRLLYAAKAAGRNRVVSVDSVLPPPEPPPPAASAEPPPSRRSRPGRGRSKTRSRR
jgi:diguanylate cyclase (GGDEF)-like protein